MAIDLNGNATGFNYATQYTEEDAATSIVASTVKVGNGSSTSNSSQISVIRLVMTGRQPGDLWVIEALPSSIQSNNATQINGNSTSSIGFQPNDLTGIERMELTDPGAYNYAVVNNGVLIGRNQLEGLSQLSVGGIEAIDLASNEVLTAKSVVVRAGWS